MPNCYKFFLQLPHMPIPFLARSINNQEIFQLCTGGGHAKFQRDWSPRPPNWVPPASEFTCHRSVSEQMAPTPHLHRRRGHWAVLTVTDFIWIKWLRQMYFSWSFFFQSHQCFRVNQIVASQIAWGLILLGSAF